MVKVHKAQTSIAVEQVGNGACSFCCKKEHEVKHLIVADALIVPCSAKKQYSFTAQICNECVKICNVLLKQQKKGEAATTTPPNHKE